MADVWVSALGLQFKDLSNNNISLPYTGNSSFVFLQSSQINTLATGSQTIIGLRASGTIIPPGALVGQNFGFAWTGGSGLDQSQVMVSGINTMILLAVAYTQGHSVLFGSLVGNGSNYTTNLTQMDFLVHTPGPPPPPPVVPPPNPSVNSSNSYIPMPQSPAVDLRTGYPTMEWYRYWQQPSFQSVSFQNVIGVSSGGTGLSSGTSGGVLYFNSPTTLQSSGTLGQYQIVFGGGQGLPPVTSLGLGSANTVLHGNINGYPSWGPVNLSTDISGTLTATNGGTGVSSALANTFFAGPPSGSPGIPAFRSIVTADFPASGVAAGIYGDARHVPQITVDVTGRITNATIKNVCPYDSTGLISGGVLSINATNAANFDLTAGVMLYESYASTNEPEQQLITFGPFTGVSVPGIATRNATYIAIDNTGSIQQFADPLTNTQRRTLTFIGAVIHNNRTTITAVNDISSTVQSGVAQTHDLMSAIGPLNLSGNVFSANGANLNINQTAGTLFKFGSNFWVNNLDPHVVSLPAQTALTFQYRLSNGVSGANTTTIDVNTYENPLGTLTPVPSLINTWHVQRINIFQTGLVRIQYGQQVYASQAAAIAGIANDPYVTETNISENGILRCYLVINRGILNLNTSATFITVSKFGAANVTSAGSVTSVGLSMPSDFTVTNSPVTSTGTLTATWNVESAKAFLAGPISGASATPTWRSIVTSDIPTSNSIAGSIPILDSVPPSGQSNLTLIGTSGRGNYSLNTTSPDANSQSCGTLSCYGGPSTSGATETRVGLFSFDTDGVVSSARGGMWRISLKSDGTSGTLSNRLLVRNVEVTPGSDNALNLGNGSLRWSTVFAATGSINTSDARDKTPVSPLNVNELEASKAIASMIGTYQWLSMVQEKGSSARLHIGLTVQSVMTVMQNFGLDPMKYGFICHDQWDAQDEVIDGNDIIVPAREAGDIYSFRPDELTMFIVRGMCDRLDIIEKKLGS